MAKEHSYFEKEERSRQVFESMVWEHGGVWHLSTPGEKQQVVFNGKEDYVFAMTLVAICVYDCPGVEIVTFELMSNHVHFIICGSRERVLEFFALFKKRLRRYLAVRDRVVDLSSFDCGDPRSIDNLESLRNHIAYTNRNNFVVDPDELPFTYPYGANSYYFNPYAKERKHGLFGQLNILKKRALVHSRSIDYPDSLVLVDGYISPVNYCRLDIGESVFRDARHYFHKLSKNVEAYREISDMLGDTIFYTDEELVDVINGICRDRFGGQRALLLGRGDKLELAKTLHFDYNADNAKIGRLLKLPSEVLDSLFPLRNK